MCWRRGPILAQKELLQPMGGQSSSARQSSKVEQWQDGGCDLQVEAGGHKARACRLQLRAMRNVVKYQAFVLIGVRNQKMFVNHCCKDRYLDNQSGTPINLIIFLWKKNTTGKHLSGLCAKTIEISSSLPQNVQCAWIGPIRMKAAELEAGMRHSWAPFTQPWWHCAKKHHTAEGRFVVITQLNIQIKY